MIYQWFIAAIEKQPTFGTAARRSAPLSARTSSQAPVRCRQSTTKLPWPEGGRSAAPSPPSCPAAAALRRNGRVWTQSPPVFHSSFSSARASPSRGATCRGTWRGDGAQRHAVSGAHGSDLGRCISLETATFQYNRLHLEMHTSLQ